MLSRSVWLAIVAHALDAAPLEMCGLLAGDPTSGRVERFYPCANAAASARVYTVDARDHLRADRHAEDNGWEIFGVVHSHTHTPAHPSPTDLAQAPDPSWRYPILSLSDQGPSLRSWRLEGGNATEEAVVVEDWLDSLPN